MVSDEQLAAAVAVSQSVLGVLRYLGKSATSGSNQAHYTKRIRNLGLDTSHFSRGAPIGVKRKGSAFKTPSLTAAEVLVFDRNNGRRESTKILLRALVEAGEPYCCSSCGQLPEWNGKLLRLEIDHKNGNPVDNRRNNLRFLCPNCHSQEPVLRASTNPRSRAARQNKLLAAQAMQATNKVEARKAEKKGPSKQHQKLPFAGLKEERIKQLMSAPIEYHKFGWAVKAGKLLGISPQKTVAWIKKWMPEFYAEKCFKVKRAPA